MRVVALHEVCEATGAPRVQHLLAILAWTTYQLTMVLLLLQLAQRLLSQASPPVGSLQVAFRKGL